jgi:hypothetical protein
MGVRRGAASIVSSLLVVVALAVGAPAASAVSLDTVKGGESALFVPFSNIQKLGQAGIFVSPIAPAYLTFTSYAEGPAIRFPVSGGAVESATMLGTVNHKGGMLIQKFNPDGTVATQLEVTEPKIVAGASLVGNALGLIPAPTADLINATHTKDAATGVITYDADAQINAVNALVLNTYFDTDAFKAGSILGHLRSKIQTKPLLF